MASKTHGFDTKPDEDIIIKNNYYADVPQEHRCKKVANLIQQYIKKIISHDQMGYSRNL